MSYMFLLVVLSLSFDWSSLSAMPTIHTIVAATSKVKMGIYTYVLIHTYIHTYIHVYCTSNVQEYMRDGKSGSFLSLAVSTRTRSGPFGQRTATRSDNIK